MRIVIDMQGAQSESRFRGIGFYTMSLVKALLENHHHADEFILALNGGLPESIELIRATFGQLLPQENIRVWQPIELSDAQGVRSVWRSQLAKSVREAFLESLKPDIVLLSSLFEGYADEAITSIDNFIKPVPTAVIFYDLIPYLYSKEYLEPNPVYSLFYSGKIDDLKKADLYLAISNATVADGMRELGLNSTSIINISSGCDAKFKCLHLDQVQSQSFFDQFNISKRFILYTGGADFRKNLPALVEAFSLLSINLRQGLQMVIVGKIPKEQRQNIELAAKKAGLDKSDLLFTGYVSDEDLVVLYNLCELFVFPSLYEGFGLPVLEAMACGAPVICSNTSSLLELAEKHEMMFDPRSARSIANKIMEVLESRPLRDQLKAYGLERVKQFSWDEVATNTLLACRRFEKKSSVQNRLRGEGFLKVLKEEVVLLTLGYPDVKEHLVEIARTIAQNHPEENRKSKLFVDISELVHRDAKTGIQRVVRSILRELLLNPPEKYAVIPVYGSLEHLGYKTANHFLSEFMDAPKLNEDSYIEAQAGDIFLGLDLQHHVVAAQSSYLQHLHGMGVKIYFVIYDLLPILLPDAFPLGSSDGHASWLKEISQYDGVTCISKAVAEEFRVWQKANIPPKLRPLEIKWFHLGADIENSNPTMGMPKNADDVFHAIGGRKTFLMVGTVEPRKGHEYVLEEFISLWKSGVDVNLVIVGKTGWAVEGLAQKIMSNPEYEKRLFWLNGVTDEYLEKVYQLSTCLIAASYGEGFGLPLIEAAQHGLPIIARDIPVFKEVATGNAFYFNGHNTGELKQAINEWLELHKVGSHPTSSNMTWLSWSKSRAQLMKTLSISPEL